MAHTLGAASAAFKIMKLVAGVFQDKTRKGMSSSEMAEIISRETHDAEMLEALQALVTLLELDEEATHPGTDTWVALKRAEALIAKVEGR